jgi:hypothetical protein
MACQNTQKKRPQHGPGEMGPQLGTLCAGHYWEIPQITPRQCNPRLNQAQICLWERFPTVQPHDLGVDFHLLDFWRCRNWSLLIQIPQDPGNDDHPEYDKRHVNHHQQDAAGQPFES